MKKNKNRLLLSSKKLIQDKYVYLKTVIKKKLLGQEDTEKNKINFQKLTPYDESDMGVYNQSLNFAWNDPELVNIALTGPYGSGKSSIIRTYIKNNEKDNILYVSLGHYKEYEGGDPKVSRNTKGDKGETYYPEKSLEGKIINQFVHQIPGKQIPQTDFNKKEKVSAMRMCLMASLLFTFLFSFIFIIDAFQIRKLTSNIMGSYMPPESIMIGIYILLFLLTSFILLLLMIKGFYGKVSLKNLKVFNTEVELYENQDKEISYFDKYLNEITYILTESKVEVVVFEDIDRFDTNIFFTKLKEINTLVNSKIKLKKGNKKQKKLKFIYLIKDEMFSVNERTKFFDFIIPVIPYIDSSNSYVKFSKLFSSEELTDSTIDYKKISERLLYDLSIFITDMRILKNIYNEYMIYKERISFEKFNLIANKLLGLIAYKNMFPDDFTKLQFNSGYVYTVLGRKEELVKRKKEEYNNEIQKIEEDIEKLNNREKEKVGAYEKLEIVEDKLSDLTKLPFHELIDLFLHQEIYEEIEDKELLNKVKTKKGFGLIVYLINNGYIDQTYIEYISYFHEGDLSWHDKNFYIQVTSHIVQDYDVVLDSPKKVLEKFEASDFDRNEILNFSLIDFAITDEHEFIDYFYNIIKREAKQDFIFEFAQSEYDSRIEFVKEINQRDHMVISSTINNDFHKYSPTTEQFKNYLLLTFDTASEDTLELINSEKTLSNYLSNDKGFLNIKKPNIKNIITAFKTLNVSFEEIDYEVSNKDLFEGVYSNNLYNLYWDMIELIINKKFGVKDKISVFQENYTIINSQKESPLFQYVHKDINVYLRVLLAKEPEQFNDSEECVLKLLNNKEIENENIKEYLNLLTTKITNIKDIEDSKLWKIVIDNGSVTYSEKNIAEYFSQKNELDSSLIAFINQATLVAFSENNLSEDKLAEFKKKIMLSNEIRIENYETILKESTCEFDIKEIIDLEENRVSFLIKWAIIDMEINNLLFIRENFPEQVLDYIEKNAEKYIDVLNDQSKCINEEEILAVLNIESVKENLKVKLLDSVGNVIETYKITDLNYPLTVEEKIIEKYFDINDLDYVIKKYKEYSSTIKTQIINYFIDNFSKINLEEITLTEVFVHDILKKEDVDVELRKHLLYLNSDILGLKEIENYLETYNEYEFIKLFNRGKQRRIENTEANKLLLEFFTDKVIRKYRLDNDKKYFIVRGMKEVVY